MSVDWSQDLILVDAQDRVVGYAPRRECHTGAGKRHRGVVVLLINACDALLLQERRHEVFDRRWDLAAASHPIHRTSGDESYEQCAARCLRSEWGTEVDLRRLCSFTYFEADGALCENELCVVLAGRLRKNTLEPNRAHMYSHRWATWDQLQYEVGRDRERFTPWLRAAVARLAGQPFLQAIS